MATWKGFKNFQTQLLSLRLRTERAHFVKMDIFQRKMWYAYQDKTVGGIVELSLDRVLEIIKANKSGEKPEKLERFMKTQIAK